MPCHLPGFHLERVSPKSIGAMIEVLTNGLLDLKKGSKIWHVAWYLLHKLKKKLIVVDDIIAVTSRLI